ncbi:hypothetical protein V1478_002898 [Vespula squamosa]|uniref:Uncharacterized protein n=1 Tax=Vespula squamosa TaxID=30214 RepID=A0ABD2BSI4_VESSQ
MSSCHKEKKTPLQFGGASYANFKKYPKDRNMKGRHKKKQEERSVSTQEIFQSYPLVFGSCGAQSCGRATDRKKRRSASENSEDREAIGYRPNPGDGTQ